MLLRERAWASMESDLWTMAVLEGEEWEPSHLLFRLGVAPSCPVLKPSLLETAPMNMANGF